MNKKIGMIGIGVLLMTILAMYVNAAVTGCMDETSAPSAYKYNDTGVIKNVTAGNVCINATDYDVDPTAAVYCSDSWANYTDGWCAYTRFYVGYAGDGTATCVATGWVVRTANVFIAADYIINTTVNGLISGEYVTNTGETATYNACTNAYTRQGPDGYCDGGGILDTNDASLHVAAGKVCASGANQAPNATLKCGTWSNCIEGASTANEYFVGYAASGTSCVDTSWVAAGTTQTATAGLRWRNTEHVDSCATLGYANTYDKGDMEKIVADGLGTAGAEFVNVLDLIVIAFVLSVIVGLIYAFTRHK
jgi:hypothetical protein